MAVLAGENWDPGTKPVPVEALISAVHTTAAPQALVVGDAHDQILLCDGRTLTERHLP